MRTFVRETIRTRYEETVSDIAPCGSFAVDGLFPKEKGDDIIATKPEVVKPQAPIRMQEYKQTTDVAWLGKNYQVEVHRVADDSLKMVKDENGQKFVDNRISVKVMRSDGSVFFSRSFTKAAFESYLNNDYRQTGVLEGLVYDKVEGNNLFFAASVSHPQTDEYIPLVVSVSNFGEVGIRLDTDLDTNGGNEANTDDDEQ
jgi:hypothetical protein